MADAFPTDYLSILARLDSIDPVTYGRTRNHLRGAVTRLSPYLTHGALSTQDVGRTALAKTTYQGAETLLRELAWRDYYRISWEQLGDRIFSDLRYRQPRAEHRLLPEAVAHGNTGIETIDSSIRELLETGYLHNHARLWTAMACCNVARTAWWEPSRWMYYHLLDGDLASNSLSWQWVAGSCRKEPYFANQESINALSDSSQSGTFLDVEHEILPTMAVPEALRKRAPFSMVTDLPATELPSLSGEVALYHAWSLNPRWQEAANSTRVLLLEPSHFSRFPISPRRLRFILELSRNIPGMRLVVADFTSLQAASPDACFRFVSHPAVSHWEGRSESVEPLFFPGAGMSATESFAKYWLNASITVDPDPS